MSATACGTIKAAISISREFSRLELGTICERKRREYFHAGVRQVWMVDLNERTVAVYSDIMKYEVFGEDARLSGGDILPGLVIPLCEVFGELDRQRSEQA